MQLLDHAGRLVGRLGPSDRAAVVSFDTHLRLWQDFTSDAARLRRVLTHDLLLEEEPEELQHGLSLVRLIDVNETTLRLWEVQSKEELLERWTELFTEEGWELFGLSRRQLLMSGAISGAVAGGGIDVMLGGASLLLGAGIGAIVGGMGAWLAGDELAKVKVLGQSLGGRTLQVGPVTAPNFPWVLLGRALLHHRVVAERPPAMSMSRCNGGVLLFFGNQGTARQERNGQ